MKVVIIFDLSKPEDVDDYEIYSKSKKLYCMVAEISNLIRSIVKYNCIQGKSIDSVDKEELIQKISDSVYSITSGYDD